MMDPRNCLALANCLRVLNISSSNCHDLSGVELMSGLVTLVASDNHLSCVDTVISVVTRLGMLQNLDLRNNTKLNRYHVLARFY